MHIPVQAHSTLLLAIISFILPCIGSPAQAQDNEMCLMCHSEGSIFEGMENAEQLVVTQEQLDGSIHGMLGMTCVDCHQDLMDFEDYPHAEELAKVDCAMCHDYVVETYNSSLHGYAAARGNERAPTCASCHGTHDILPGSDPGSRVNHANVQITCANCHGTSGLLTNELVKMAQPFAAYAQSVHGLNVLGGLGEAATCTDCHGTHNLKGPADPESMINTRNVSATCGQCHSDIQEDYDRSIHGLALMAGVSDSPTCNDCHGEHLILSPRDDEATTHAGKIATETCGNCHDDPTIISKYSLQAGVVGSYSDSYHGWTTKRGYENAATCVSCHTAHLVLPATVPESSIHESNLLATCQTCHPDATEPFVYSYTHAETSITTNPIDRVIRTIYMLLIAFTIGGMGLHNLIILIHYMRKKKKEVKTEESIVRLDHLQIIQHMALQISFIGLVITGFALRFPDAGWVQLLAKLGMTEPARGLLHRIFAVVMVATSFYHLWYIFFNRRGKEEFGAMLPALHDVTDAKTSMLYYLGISRDKPRYGRYDYTQKAEYWALIWGTAVMALTGFVLWFPEMAVRVFPTWIVTASQTIHYYEAWLATLAIIVWHLFFVIFYPGEYPMNWAWVTGKMTKRSIKEHHTRWYEEELADDFEILEEVTEQTEE